MINKIWRRDTKKYKDRAQFITWPSTTHDALTKTNNNKNRNIHSLYYIHNLLYANSLQ